MTLTPVQVGELLGGSPNPILFQGDMGSAPVLNTIVSRPLDGLWEMRRRITQPPQPIVISYGLTDAQGQDGQLSLAGPTPSVITATMQAIPPVVTRSNPNFEWVEGGVVLHLDVGSAVGSGDYSGTLSVTVNQL